MKKLISVLLVVMMLAGMTVCAFAAGSPTQDTTGAPAVVNGAAADKEAEEEEADAEEVAEAEAAEEEAVKAITESEAKDEATEESLIVALGSLPEDATPAMEQAFEQMVDELVLAKKDLADKGDAAVPADVVADAGEKAVAAGQPFRAAASEYPATITIAVDNPEDFVGLMVFVNGKWEKINCTVNDDGTVTFVLDKPCVLSIVSALVEAA